MIDECAAIPLPLVKQLMGPYLIFMASTIHGYGSIDTAQGEPVVIDECDGIQ